MHVHGALVGLAVHVPDLVHQLAAGEDLVLIGEQLEQQHELLLRQLRHALVAGDGEGIVVQHRVADLQPVLVDDARSPQQRRDAQQHLLLVHRLDHVVVRADDEALVLVRGLLLGRDHQDRNLAAGRAQGLGELVAVHARHHDVQHDQIDVLAVQHLQRLDAVPGGDRLVAVLGEHRLHQLARVVVVLNHQYMKHFLTSFGSILAAAYKPSVNHSYYT